MSFSESTKNIMNDFNVTGRPAYGVKTSFFYSNKIISKQLDANTPVSEPIEAPRVKWADDLVEIKTFKKYPTVKRVEKLRRAATLTSRVAGKSILKAKNLHKRHYVSNSDVSETEASSN